MSLTKERTKKYREKLKEDEEKYKEEKSKRCTPLSKDNTRFKLICSNFIEAYHYCTYYISTKTCLFKLFPNIHVHPSCYS